MKIAMLALLAPLALATAACPGDPAPPPPLEAAREPEPLITEATRQIPLEDMAQAGVSGELIITPFPDSVTFHITINDGPPESTLGTRIQTGTCSMPGEEVVVLEAVRTGVLGNGRSQRGLYEDPHRLLDGNHVAAVYAPAAEPGRDRPLACAAIPVMQ